MNSIVTNIKQFLWPTLTWNETAANIKFPDFQSKPRYIICKISLKDFQSINYHGRTLYGWGCKDVAKLVILNGLSTYHRTHLIRNAYKFNNGFGTGYNCSFHLEILDILVINALNGHSWIDRVDRVY